MVTGIKMKTCPYFILSSMQVDPLLVILYFDPHENQRPLSGSFEVPASLYERHIYEKIVNSIVNRWFCNSSKAH
jgi:hypothetical protein